MAPSPLVPLALAAQGPFLNSASICSQKEVQAPSTLRGKQPLKHEYQHEIEQAADRQRIG